jgi:hypothetical protein
MLVNRYAVTPWLGAADAIRSTEAARVRHACRRGGGLAARGARSAARQDYLTTAKALDLTIPESFLLRADELIE